MDIGNFGRNNALRPRLGRQVGAMDSLGCYKNSKGELVKVGISKGELKLSGEESSQLVTVSFPSDVDLQEVMRAADSLFETHCSHAHDCCGQWYCSPMGHKATLVQPRTWEISLSWSRNV